MTKICSLIIGSGLLLSVLLVAGCSKMTPEEARIRQDYSSIPDDMPVKILGEVEFVSGVPKDVPLDDGRSLTITATKQADDMMEMEFQYESTEVKAAGLIKESYTENSRFLLRPGMRCAPKFGDDIAVVLRPSIIGTDGNLLP